MRTPLINIKIAINLAINIPNNVDINENYENDTVFYYVIKALRQSIVFYNVAALSWFCTVTFDSSIRISLQQSEPKSPLHYPKLNMYI